MVTPLEHWSAAWTDRDPTEVSWFQPEAATSLRLAKELVGNRDDAIVDVAGGVSRLAVGLLTDGYRDVTVVDIAEKSLDRLVAECEKAHHDRSALHTVCADATSWTPDRSFALWHDRAGYHFLTDDLDRARYRSTMADSVLPGAHAIMAMFGPDGPER
jgi:SAM-dependent methyltransferase